MKKIILASLLITTILFFAHGQDPTFSQFYANRIYLNPAFAGSQQGLRLAATYRSQWNYVPGGFNTYAVTADIQEPYLNSGFGFVALQDVEGEGRLTTTTAGFIYGYILRLSSTTNIHMAVKTSFSQKSVDWTKFTFTDQLDPLLGVVRPTTALPILETKSYADFDAGLVARFMAKIGDVETHNNIGFAVHHLTEPDESLQEIETPLPRRFTFHMGTMFPIISYNYSQKRVIYISPNFKFDWQNNIKVVTYGLYALSNPVYLGVLYQNKDGLLDFDNTNSLIFTAGIEGRLNKDVKFTLGYSYDLNTTGLGTRVQGVHELTLMLNFETASMFGLPVKGKGGRRYRGGQHGRSRKSVECYKFKGRNSISIY